MGGRAGHELHQQGRVSCHFRRAYGEVRNPVRPHKRKSIFMQAASERLDLGQRVGVLDKRTKGREDMRYGHLQRGQGGGKWTAVGDGMAAASECIGREFQPRRGFQFEVRQRRYGCAQLFKPSGGRTIGTEKQSAVGRVGAIGLARHVFL